MGVDHASKSSADCGRDVHGWKAGRCEQCGVQIDQPDDAGYTRLAKAAFLGQQRVVEELLARGANPNARTKDDFWPLTCAAQKGHVDIVKVLVRAGADVRAATNVGNTALIAACINGHSDAARFLIDAGSDVNARDVDGNVVLQAAAQNCDSQTLEQLLEHGADLHAGDRVGDTIVGNAVMAGRAENVRLLLARGAQLKWDAETMCIVCGKGYLEMAKLLVSRGADVNAPEPRMRLTPLLGAAAYGHLETVTYLVEKGADLTATDRMGNTAVALATRKGHSGVVAYLTAVAARRR